jgi:hypothetical protein
MDENTITEGAEREEIFSKAVRAGKRTYFFDVKSTKNNDFYLTITESKKRFEQDGRFHFEKRKLFLYKEDFLKFADGLNEAVNFIISNNYKFEGTEIVEERLDEEEEVLESTYVDVNFDDLGKR